MTEETLEQCVWKAGLDDPESTLHEADTDVCKQCDGERYNCDYYIPVYVADNEAKESAK